MNEPLLASFVRKSRSAVSRPYTARGFELGVYLALVFWFIWIIVECTWDLSSQDTPGLQHGYMLGRKMDNTDAQYRGFRDNLPALIILAFVFVLLSQFTVYLTAGRSSDVIPAKLFTSLLLSCIVFSIFYGLDILKILFFNILFYFVAKTTQGHYVAPVIYWVFSITVLLMINYFDASNLPFGRFLDLFKGMQMNWTSSFNFGILRMISFGMDNHWRLKMKNYTIQDFHSHCKDCKLEDCEKLRIEASLPDSNYNLVNFLAYMLYLPLYLAGPIITFNDFISQTKRRSKSISFYSTFLYGVRWIFLFLTMEVMIHAFHVIAISKARTWHDFSAFQITMVGFWSLKHIWLKLTVIWKFFRLWGLMDGIDTVENMTRCMFNQHSPSEFWRTWHRSFNRWIIRYMYIPLGGKHKMIYNIWIIFTFVAFWHDIELHLLAWGWIIALFLIPEYFLTRLFNRKVWIQRLGFFHRHLCSMGASLNIGSMVFANLIGYSVKLDGMKEILEKYASPQGINFLILSFLFLFVLVQFQFIVRELEQNKKDNLKSQRD